MWWPANVVSRTSGGPQMPLNANMKEGIPLMKLMKNPLQQKPNQKPHPKQKSEVLPSQANHNTQTKACASSQLFIAGQNKQTNLHARSHIEKIMHITTKKHIKLGTGLMYIFPLRKTRIHHLVSQHARRIYPAFNRTARTSTV